MIIKNILKLSKIALKFFAVCIFPTSASGLDGDVLEETGSRILCCRISRAYAKHHRFNLKKPSTRREMMYDKFSINTYFIINFRLGCTLYE
jgi:hypothetical protein